MAGNIYIISLNVINYKYVKIVKSDLFIYMMYDSYRVTNYKNIVMNVFNPQ